MENRKQRVKPFLFVSAFYGFNTYMFYSIDQLNDTFLFILGSISLSVIILSFITLFWKISIHCAAIAGAIGIFLSVSQKFPLSDLLIPTAISVLLTGLVMTSRLSLKAHSYSEVYIGTLFGFALNYVFVYLTL
ncbi:MAG: PA-phosphatase [Bacteroidota bacterium]